MSKIDSLLSNRTFKKCLLIMYDIIAFVIAAYLALWVRFDFAGLPVTYLDTVHQYLFLDVCILITIFYLFRLYSNVWSYASITELLNLISGCFMFEFISLIYKMICHVSLPRSFYVLHFISLVILTFGIRFSYRVLRYLYIRMVSRKRALRTMIIGAGDAGRLLIQEIELNKSFENRVVCVIDDNKDKKGSYINGIPIVGDKKTIAKNCEKYDISEIIIAIPSAKKSDIAKIVEECQKTKAKIKILPKMATMLSGNLMGTVKEISYEDFLGRDQVVVDLNEIIDNIKDKVILVTGGGGSIGSELCRQIAKCSPKTLIIFDIYENNAYEIQQELLRNYPELDLHTIIGSVRDYDRLEKVFKEFQIEQVYHAAAHKHVPLMEVSPNEAIKNNAFGTLNTCKLADKYKVKKFVLVSTDKAVRPTNVMGASKRICEMIIQTYDKKSKNTDFVAVRFGNVLGSNGSVIPLFLKQIENGGPVTVTHKEIERFFMTIPEAVSLILQAGCYAKGGEIFVLDMGKPVKIYDLACKLIRYKGFEPDVDIPIKITGLRPGEKLYEERLMEEEGLEKTPNKLISIGKPLQIPKTFLKDLDELINAAYQNSDDIKDRVARIVTTYKIDKERIGK